MTKSRGDRNEVGAKSQSKFTPPRTVAEALRRARERYPTFEKQGDKKNFAEEFSRQLANVFAFHLRTRFPTILPDGEGRKQESRARSAHGFKKLDVNYSTIELGLGLGISIKTINARDKKSGRYAKNYSRVENELRAEATDYHKRQPFSTLVAVLFLPVDACDDGVAGKRLDRNISSFGAAVRTLRRRAGRTTPRNDFDLFERAFVALYDEVASTCTFHDVMIPPPRNRRPRESESMTLEQVAATIISSFEQRNEPPFEWAP